MLLWFAKGCSFPIQFHIEKPCKIPFTIFMNFSWDEENETGFVTKGKEIDLIINLFLQRKTLYCCGQWGDALFASFASLAETTEPEVIH